MYRLPAVATLSLLALLLPGATLERLTLDEMTQAATSIVRGKVSSSYAAAHGRVVYTHYRIEVTETWKGTDSGTADVVVPGGSVRGLRQAFSGAPVLSANTDYVFFLWRARSGLTHVIGLSQGIFTLRSNDQGTLTALRPAAGEPMVDRTGKPVAAEALSIPLERLRSQVRQTLAVAEKK